jgi:predicted  nucleic acid-binding Zn-ribbon protein
MHPDLPHLIQLQELDTTAEDARRTLAAMPERLAALNAQLGDARAAQAAARDRLAENQAQRRAIEKDLAVVQGRLTKFKDQLMEVKTNREYQAMQKEIETAGHEVQAFEERILERMLEADEIGADITAADAALAAAERDVAAQRTALEAEQRDTEKRLDEIGRARMELVKQIPESSLALFDQVARSRKGLALSRVRDGLCSVCHVRVRPQTSQDVRFGKALLQCESCQRILYYIPEPAAAPPDTPPQTT